MQRQGRFCDVKLGNKMPRKMLRCGSNTERDRTDCKTEDTPPMEDKKFTEIHIKIETLATDLNKLCRVCLKEGSIEIFGANNGTENLCESIYEIAGIKVTYEDPHPKYLCQNCLALLQDAMLFRRTALKSDRILNKLEPDPNTVKYETAEVSEVYSKANDGLNKEIIQRQIIGQQKLIKEQPKRQQTIELSCIICNISFSTIEELHKHRRRKVCRHTKWSCKICDLTFDKLEDHSAHKQSVHEDSKRITCNICNKSYTENYYRRHKLAMHSESDVAEARICDICGKKMSGVSYLARHRATHFYELPFKCTQCPYRGRFTESLKLHMRTHTGERPYQCEHCSSRFISKSNLNKHVLTHNRVFKFNCERCGKGFYSKKELDRHINVTHTGKKDHACRVCGKSFGYRKQMMKHELKVHKRAKLLSGRTPIYLKVETMKQERKNATENNISENDANENDSNENDANGNDTNENDTTENDTTENDATENDTTETIA